MFQSPFGELKIGKSPYAKFAQSLGDLFQSPFGELKIGKFPYIPDRCHIIVSVPFRGIKNRKAYGALTGIPEGVSFSPLSGN